MQTELLEFHKSCKTQYKYLLEYFNILFYGFGSKNKLLEYLFPESKIYDLKVYKLTDIIEDLIFSGYHTNKKASIKDIDFRLSRTKKILILIFLNFDFNIIELQDLKNIKMIGTLENIEISFDRNDLINYNFIMRDLTTFEKYSGSIFELEIEQDKVKKTKMVLESLSNKSKYIFKNILITKKATVDNIFEKTKIILMIRKKNFIIESLKEFIDHKIIKIKNCNEIIVKLNKKEIERLIESKIFD